jgi:hypothetical protein
MIFTLVKRLESYSRYGTYSLLYRRRWQIELFFKAIKQNLEIARFYGTSEKVMKTHRISVLHDVPRLLWWFNQMFGALQFRTTCHAVPLWRSDAVFCWFFASGNKNLFIESQRFDSAAT